MERGGLRPGAAPEPIFTYPVKPPRHPPIDEPEAQGYIACQKIGQLTCLWLQPSYQREDSITVNHRALDWTQAMTISGKEMKPRIRATDHDADYEKSPIPFGASWRMTRGDRRSSDNLTHHLCISTPSF